MYVVSSFGCCVLGRTSCHLLEILAGKNHQVYAFFSLKMSMFFIKILFTSTFFKNVFSASNGSRGWAEHYLIFFTVTNTEMKIISLLKIIDTRYSQLNIWLRGNWKFENNYITVAMNISHFTAFKILDKKLSTISWADMMDGFLQRMLWVRNASKVI